MDALGIVTAPIWRTLAIAFAVVSVLCVVFGGGAVSMLYSRNVDLQKKISKLEADNEKLRGYNKASDDARLMTEEQCAAKIEAIRNKPSDEISPDAEIDDALIERLRRGSLRDHGKDRGAADAAGKGANPGTARGKSP